MPTINILHLSTHDEECGIAKYQKDVVDGMGKRTDVNNVFFEISPNKLKVMQGAERERAVQKLVGQMADFDILHIQHEYSFYFGDELAQIVARVKALGKKVMFTVHTAPHAHNAFVPPVLEGFGPRSLVRYARIRQKFSQFRNNHIVPMQQADLVVVPNKTTKESLVQNAVPAEIIEIIEHPIPNIGTSQKSTEITAALGKKQGDIIFATIGFLSEAKGIIHAVKALSYLPENYKLAIVGGAHPSGVNDEFYDLVTDVIYDRKLIGRVYITGYVQSDDDLNALIRETDMCVYPYNKKYYGYVSSAAISNAIANSKPVVAYPTNSLVETNARVPFINFTRSFNYYELARSIKAVDIAASVKRTKGYAQAYSLEKQSARFAECYVRLAQA